MIAPDIATVASLRARLWDAGFRPVPVLTKDKAPLGRDWLNRARQDPPDCLRFSPVPHALNTGILCDGLRAIDIDVDDPAVAARCRALIIHHLGEAPLRSRQNSPRCLLLYRAPEGAPSKLVLAGKAGKIEVLGKGQQFVAFGLHTSGAELEWFPDAPGSELRDALPAASEDDNFKLLGELAFIVEAEPPRRTNGQDHTPGQLQADPLRIAAALNDIPNIGPANWTAWNDVCMAIWAATGGDQLGWEALRAWSARNPAYDPAKCSERWNHYFKSPPTRIGAGTIFHMAAKARGTRPRPRPGINPPPTDDATPEPRQSEDDDFVLPIEFSENNLSYLFSSRHQDRLVYVHGWGKWLRYHAGRWHEDHTVRVYDAARAICAEQGERALHTLPAKSASKVAAIINKAGCIAAIERLARHHKPQTRDRDLFDADQGRIGSPNRPKKLQRKRKE
jgi:hypothetical protein